MNKNKEIKIERLPCPRCFKIQENNCSAERPIYYCSGCSWFFTVEEAQIARLERALEKIYDGELTIREIKNLCLYHLGKLKVKEITRGQFKVGYHLEGAPRRKRYELVEATQKGTFIVIDPEAD